MIVRVQVGSGVHGTAVQAGAELAANAHRFVSRLAAGRYLGYLRAQKAAMTGLAGAHTNRPELVAVHGYDTKYAMHALQVGLQGVELLTTGRITLPVPEPQTAWPGARPTSTTQDYQARSVPNGWPDETRGNRRYARPSALIPIRLPARCWPRWSPR
jgi:RNA repair pathway DNA polymerase beta family